MTPAVSSKIEFINGVLTSHGISKNQLAKSTGMHQSQVSRILGGKIKRDSKGLRRLYEFARSRSGQTRPDPRISTELMDAVQYAWDGTESGAAKLAKVIRAIGSLHQSDEKVSGLKKASKQPRV